MTQPEPISTPQFLSDGAPPVLIFGGKGGVGKTTLSAATAISQATLHPDETVILVSTDPAHSISDAIADTGLPSNLRVEELDAAIEHDMFMSANIGVLREIASRGTFLDDEDIEGFLALSLPGVDELMNFLRLSQWFEEEEADRFIVDTAPTGHALRLLSMPQVTAGWMEAIEALLGKHRYMASVFGGGGGADPVEQFLASLQSALDNIAGVLSESSLTQFVPVFNAEQLSIAETERLLEDLEALDISSPELICNRLVPPGVTGSLGALRVDQSRVLASLPERISARSVVGVSLSKDEPRGGALGSFFNAIVDPGSVEAGETASIAASVRGRVAISGNVSLVAGKGGVGKTTVSCATALHLASTGTRTLLVSTDPAGSLGDALGMEIGDRPTPIVEGLDAIQLDADSELHSLKDEYADEINRFFEELAVDLSFDREALEHLLELAPTGIDEVMALVRMTELLAEGDDHAYSSVVLDTAPTGHTLRLLELPETAQLWLEQIFAVLVKYERLISLPKLNERLLRLSRGVKKLRTLLGDPTKTSLLAVTIPTSLAVAETGRLVKQADAIGVPVSGVVINQLTQIDEDVVSASIAERESREVQALQKLARGLPVVQVTRGDDLRGPAKLADLGAALIDIAHSGAAAA